MPKLTRKPPKYSLHRGTGQAVVMLDGKEHYLGRHGSPQSLVLYAKLIAQWSANGQSLSGKSTSGRRSKSDDLRDAITVVEVIDLYWQHAKDYYGDTATRRGTANNLKPTLSLLKQMCGREPAADFGPLRLRAVREKLVEAGRSRRYCNDVAGRIKRMFKWAVGEELLHAQVFQGLAVVEGLKKGRTKAREGRVVKPVPDSVVQATLAYLGPVVADMVRLQLLLGCRSGELVILRPMDIDRTKDVWAYRPARHKTEHHGLDRVIFIGPRAQAILLPYLLRADSDFCFSPQESEQKRLAELHERRATPMSCGNTPGSNRVRHPKRRPGRAYTSDSYRAAIQRACELAFPAPETVVAGDALRAWRHEHTWHPHRLRHARATEIRARFGLEAVQTVLGHAHARISEVYAERNAALAAAVMKEVG